jgi:integrase/recombinase XerD
MSSPERQLFLDRLALRNLAPKSTENYMQALLKATRFHMKSPLKMDGREIEEFLLHELRVEKLAPATVNLHIAAFKTFFNLVAPESKVMNDVVKVKEIRKLPTVLTVPEVGAMLLATDNIKHRAILEVLYCSGVRLQECVNLKIKDLDSKQMLVHVERGKGGAARYTSLAKSALDTLEKYYLAYKPVEYLFEGHNNMPISERMVGVVVKCAARRAGIEKPVSPHTMRHTFATHLLEQNVSIRVIQKLLGHTNIKTTTIYLHVSNIALTNVTNPLDVLKARLPKGDDK